MSMEVTKQSYLAFIRKNENTDYWIDAPDIPGCIACGETADEAMKNFEEALILHLSRAYLQPPRKVSEVLSSEHDAYVEAYMVEIDTASKLRLHFSRLS